MTRLSLPKIKFSGSKREIWHQLSERSTPLATTRALKRGPLMMMFAPQTSRYHLLMRSFRALLNFPPPMMPRDTLVSGTFQNFQTSDRSSPIKDLNARPIKDLNTRTSLFVGAFSSLLEIALCQAIQQQQKITHPMYSFNSMNSKIKWIPFHWIQFYLQNTVLYCV